jgi:hypothetical protein
MARLEKLGLRDQWIYEVLVSTFHDDTPHASPIGVWAHGPEALAMDVYDGSQTLANIMQNGHFAANFPPDVGMLHAALRAPERLAFAKARRVLAPLVVGCTASVELTLRHATPDRDKVRIVGDVKDLRHETRPRLINRAEGLLLESLVLTTRLEQRGPTAVLDKLIENHRVVAKVAPGSDYARVLAALIREIDGHS